MLLQFKKYFITHDFIWPTKELCGNYYSHFIEKESGLREITLINITKRSPHQSSFSISLFSIPLTTWLLECPFSCLKSFEDSTLPVCFCPHCDDLWALYSPLLAHVQAQGLETFSVSHQIANILDFMGYTSLP